MIEIDRIYCGDCLDILHTFPDESIDCCVTSPPYYGLRDYGIDGQIGLEPSADEYVAKLVEVFREVRRVLKAEGSLWLNLGDSYAGTSGCHKGGSDKANSNTGATNSYIPPKAGKPKDLIGIPWLVAFALQADGWWLRSDIIWHKPNCMPESVTDRPTKAHEFVFLLTKSQKYHYDNEAVKEPVTGNSHRRGGGKHPKSAPAGSGIKANQSFESACTELVTSRNKRDVWSIHSQPFAAAHFAVMPEALVEPCILAGCPEGGIVLDPFFGAGTVGAVAQRFGRHWVGIDLNPKYNEIAKQRIAAVPVNLSRFAEVATQ